jgi:hypothetical protein
MSDDSAEEEARIAEEARRKALEAAEITKQQLEAQAGRAAANTVTGEGGEEAVRQSGLIYGGLIGIAVVMVQGFLEAPSHDTTARVSVIAFSVAIPLLAALVLVNRQETFRRRKTPSVGVTIAESVAQGAAFVGLVAGFWHIDWIAGVVFLATGFVAMFVHSAGWWRLEREQDPSQVGEP